MTPQRSVLEGLAELRAARELIASGSVAKASELLGKAHQHFSSAARELGLSPGETAAAARLAAAARRILER